MTRTALLTAATCATIVCTFPAAAGAATVTGTLEPVDGERPDYRSLDMRFEGEPGEANQLTMTVTTEEVVFEDLGAEIEVRGACASTGPNRAVCSAGDDRRYKWIELGDGDDQLQIENGSLIEVWGGEGNDTLHGGSGPERIDGELGDDLVDGGAGIDTIIGGGGSDELRADEAATPFEHDVIIDGERDESAASDTIVGRSGLVSLSYASRRERVTVDLRAGVAGAAGEQDRLIDIHVVGGGEGPDVLLGSDGDDSFGGGGGADRIEGRGGDDYLTGGDGADRVSGGPGNDGSDGNLDNVRDIQNCGSGDDFVADSDKRDRLRPSCEDASWLRSPGAHERITVHPAISRRRAVFRSTCAARAGCRGRITLVTAGQRLGLGRGRIDIERTRKQIRHKVVVRLNARGRKHMRRGGYVRVVIFSPGRPCHGCTNPRPVKSGFTTRMKR
jgi:hypothetical protein